jgi:pimeloyl-ACP methyl ester carboxylesterase
MMEKDKICRDTARLRGIDIFFRDTRTAGPAILCLHGRYGRGETWMDLSQRYGKKYRIIAPDQRGHGLSGKPVAKYTAGEMAADMAGLLKHLQLDQVIVVGHSMGGRIAGHLAALHPELVGALAILDKSASGPAGPITLPLDQVPPTEPLTRDWPMPFASREKAREFIRSVMASDLGCQYFMESLVETQEGYRMMFSAQAIAANIAYEENWFHLLPQIKCPVLMIRAKGGGAVSDEDFAKMQSLIPNCSAHEISHPDHNVHLADKEMFYGYFDEWLKRL